jgi:hypothetical protein
LQFDHYFHWFNGHNNEKADVDVRSSQTQNQWQNVGSFANADFQEHRTINISAQAGGAANAQVRFRYYLGSDEWWWEVDQRSRGCHRSRVHDDGVLGARGAEARWRASSPRGGARTGAP